jgi:hypothetical protein
MPDHQSPKTDAYLDALRELPRAFYETQLVAPVEKFAGPIHVDRSQSKIGELGQLGVACRRRRGYPACRAGQVVDSWRRKPMPVLIRRLSPALSNSL